MSETPKLTSAAYERLESEVQVLETEGRREKADKISVARDFGDLKENAEYHAAKEDAAMLEAKIARMRDTLRSAEIVEATEAGAAGMGSTVTWVDDASGRESASKLVPGVEASPGEGRLSIDSPVGRALAGTKPGDTRTLETPRGTRTLRVLGVEHS
ncbi:MAG: transcription elongation factor GreA [Thermoleophilaceae bacterium]